MPFGVRITPCLSYISANPFEKQPLCEGMPSANGRGMLHITHQLAISIFNIAIVLFNFGTFSAA